MNTLENMTARKLANSMNAAGNASALVAEACTIAFAGKIVKAEKASLVHQTMLLLIDDRSKHNAKMDKHCKGAKLNDEQTKQYKKENGFAGLYMFQTFASRWIKKSATHKAKRVSLKTTGKAAEFSIALVSVSVPAGKVDSKKTSVTKGKQLQNLMNDSSISLPEAIASLVDAYTLKAVQDAIAKLS